MDNPHRSVPRTVAPSKLMAAQAEIETLRGEVAYLKMLLAGKPQSTEIERLRHALDWLLHETMYKDHPEASQNAMDVLNREKAGDQGRQNPRA